MELTLWLPPLLDGLTLPMLESAPMFMDNRLLVKHVANKINTTNRHKQYHLTKYD